MHLMGCILAPSDEYAGMTCVSVMPAVATITVSGNGFPGLFTDTSEPVRFYLLVFFFVTF